MCMTACSDLYLLCMTMTCCHLLDVLNDDKQQEHLEMSWLKQVGFSYFYIQIFLFIYADLLLYLSLFDQTASYASS